MAEGEAFSPEARQRLQLLTGWAVCMNHATAVSSAGAGRGAEKGSCEQSSPPPSSLLPPLKMCHLNMLTSVSGSILPGVARGRKKDSER